MKRKTRFNEGGLNPFQGDDVDPFSAVRNEEGGTYSRAEGPISESMRDETSGRELSTRRNLETGEYYSTEPIEAIRKAATRAAPKATAIKAASGSGRSTGRGGPTAAEMAEYYAKAASRAEIPGAQVRGDLVGKTKAERIKDEIQDNTLKALGAVTGAGILGIGGVLGIKRALAAKRAREAGIAKEAAEKFSSPQARQMGEKVTSRPQKTTKETAEALEKAKPILQSRPDTKASRASRTRRTEEDSGMEFSKGGMASRRGDGCAMRGKTRGKIY